MTQEELIETLSKARELLVSVSEDLYWQDFSTDDTSHPDLTTDLNDALHHCDEVIQKLGGQQP